MVGSGGGPTHMCQSSSFLPLVPCWAWHRWRCLLLGWPAGNWVLGVAILLLLATWLVCWAWRHWCCLLLGCPAGPAILLLRSTCCLPVGCPAGHGAAGAFGYLLLATWLPCWPCVARAAGCCAAGAFGNLVFRPLCLRPAVSPHLPLAGNDVYEAWGTLPVGTPSGRAIRFRSPLRSQEG